MCAGVGKSGSPAPKPMTRSPAACSALALASTASVADSAMAPILRETRAGSTGLLMTASSHPARRAAPRAAPPGLLLPPPFPPAGRAAARFPRGFRGLDAGAVGSRRGPPFVQVLETRTVQNPLDNRFRGHQPPHHLAHVVLLVPQH